LYPPAADRFDASPATALSVFFSTLGVYPDYLETLSTTKMLTGKSVYGYMFVFFVKERNK